MSELKSGPRLLDLFCGAGGAAMGYRRAGFGEIVGVDIKPQPNYPFRFVQMDALEWDTWDFDAIHASPPCQAYTHARHLGNRGRSDHPRLIEPTRERLRRPLSSVVNPMSRDVSHEMLADGMGIDWMPKTGFRPTNELREAIPPAYTEFIGKQLIGQMERVA